jgi:signal peptidase I
MICYNATLIFLTEKRQQHLMNSFAVKLLLTLFNALIPGCGFAVIGRWRVAFLVTMAFMLCLALFGWSRWILLPNGIPLMLALLFGIWIINSASFMLPRFKCSSAGARPFVRGLVFSTLFTLLSVAGFVYKPYWLGVQFYFIPSPSMQPTLYPGDFILVDCWAYRHHAPHPGDIVVFLHRESEQWLVKRIANWPDGQSQQNGLWYMLGDNRNNSRDSRAFGGIDGQAINGQVRLVLLRIDHDNHPLKDSFFKPVQ